MTDQKPPPSPTSSPPGYYPDPQGVMRWWDGRQWTPSVMALPAPHHPVQPKQKEPPSKKKLLVVIVILITCLVAFVACVSALGVDTTGSQTTTADETEEAEPASTATSAAKPKKTAAADTVKDGDYLVGREIKTGTWKTAKVPDEGVGLCYADTETKKGDILEQEVGNAGDSVIIRIKSNAYTFSSSGCGTWKRVD